LNRIEVVVDLLSEDAVAIAPGTITRIEGWGGDESLSAKVRRIDPAGFTKVSALGIEEQRVNVILDITGAAEKWRKLGHAYRVTARIITSHKEDALRVPISALFRNGEKWVVYTDREGIANRTELELGAFSPTHAEVLAGLDEGDRVIVYPSDRVSNGLAVTERQTEDR